jgi:hypothetical protein
MAVPTHVTIETTGERQLADVQSGSELIRGIRLKARELSEDLIEVRAASRTGRTITARPNGDRWAVSFDPPTGTERMDRELEAALSDLNTEVLDDDSLAKELDAWLSGENKS